MSSSKDNDMNTGKGQFLVYQAEDGTLKLEVRLEDETVWLSQKLMAELFQKDVRTINEHIKNIYEEGELDPNSTIRKFRIVQTEGRRQVERMVDFYNLDQIISRRESAMELNLNPEYSDTQEFLHRDLDDIPSQFHFAGI